MATNSIEDVKDEGAAAPAEALRAPQKRRFVKAVRMPAEEARRQSHVVQTAWTTFADRESAMAFLNSDHDELGGRPLEVATTSDEGLEAVERVLAAIGDPRAAAA